jgi:hypothetical protein
MEVVFTNIAHIIHSDNHFRLGGYSFYLAVRLLRTTRRRMRSLLKFQVFILRIIVFVADNYKLRLSKFVLQNNCAQKSLQDKTRVSL